MFAQKRCYPAKLIFLPTLMYRDLILTDISIDFSNSILDVFCIFGTFESCTFSHVEIITWTFVLFPVWIVGFVTRVDPGPAAASVD